MSSAAPPARTPPGVWVAGRGGGLRPGGAGSRGVPPPPAQPGQTSRPGGGRCSRPAPRPARAPPRRRPRSRCCRRRCCWCCRKMDPGCTSANCRGEREGEKRKKDGREEKGAGVGGLAPARRAARAMGGGTAKCQGLPRRAPTLRSVSGLTPPPPSPFNLRQPYRQLTHIVSTLLTYSYRQGQDPGCCRSAPPIVLQQHARSPAAPISGELSL